MDSIVAILLDLKLDAVPRCCITFGPLALRPFRSIVQDINDDLRRHQGYPCSRRILMSDIFWFSLAAAERGRAGRQTDPRMRLTYYVKENSHESRRHRLLSHHAAFA